MPLPFAASLRDLVSLDPREAKERGRRREKRRKEMLIL